MNHEKLAHVAREFFKRDDLEERAYAVREFYPMVADYAKKNGIRFPEKYLGGDRKLAKRIFYAIFLAMFFIIPIYRVYQYDQNRRKFLSEIN